MRVSTIAMALILGAGLGQGGVVLAQDSQEEPSQEETTGTGEQSGPGEAVSEDARQLENVEGARDEEAQRLRGTALESNEGFRRGVERSGGAADVALGAGRPDFARPEVGRPEFARPERPSRPEFAGRAERPDLIRRPDMPDMPERPDMPDRGPPEGS